MLRTKPAHRDGLEVPTADGIQQPPMLGSSTIVAVSPCSFDVWALLLSAGLFLLLLVDVQESLALCLRGLLAVVVMHLLAEVTHGVVEVLLHVAWTSHLDVPVAVRGIQPLGQGVPFFRLHQPNGCLERFFHRLRPSQGLESKRRQTRTEYPTGPRELAETTNGDET